MILERWSQSLQLAIEPTCGFMFKNSVPMYVQKFPPNKKTTQACSFSSAFSELSPPKPKHAYFLGISRNPPISPNRCQFPKDMFQ